MPALPGRQNFRLRFSTERSYSEEPNGSAATRLAHSHLFRRRQGPPKRRMLFIWLRRKCYRKVTTMKSLRTILSSLLLLNLAGFTLPVHALDDLLITEFMAQNDNTLADEDGDFPDWI